MPTVLRVDRIAVRWTRLSCRKLRNALAYNLGNFKRALASPDSVEQWSLSTLREQIIKIGAKVVCNARYVTFQLAKVTVPRDLFADIPRLHRSDGKQRNCWLPEAMAANCRGGKWANISNRTCGQVQPTKVTFTVFKHT